MKTLALILALITGFLLGHLDVKLRQYPDKVWSISYWKPFRNYTDKEFFK